PRPRERLRRMGARQRRAPRRRRRRGAADGDSVSAPRALLLALAVAACGTQAGSPTSPPSARAAFASLRYDEGPPPTDKSNKYGDDAAAAKLGQKLYFEKRLSGRLLDPDNGML